MKYDQIPTSKILAGFAATPVDLIKILDIIGISNEMSLRFSEEISDGPQYGLFLCNEKTLLNTLEVTSDESLNPLQLSRKLFENPFLQNVRCNPAEARISTRKKGWNIWVIHTPKRSPVIIAFAAWDVYFPKFSMHANGQKSYMTLAEAGEAFNNGMLQVEIGEHALERNFSVRKMIVEEKQAITDYADLLSEAK